MLSQELRPKTLDDMAGQEEAKRLIKAIIKNPENAPKVLLFCGSFGTGKCVTGDTRVHTSDGYKRIDELVQNPEYDEEGFMDISPQNIKVVGSTATHYYYGGKKKVVEISSPSFKVRGTYNHRVKVYGGKGGLQWKKLKDITTDDFVAIPLKHDILFDNKSKTYEFMKGDISERDKGYFLGTLFFNILSYGYVNDYYFDGIIIASTNVEYLSKGLKEDYYSIVDNKGICIKTSLSRYIKDFFTDVVTIPEFVFSSNREFICGFLSVVCEYYRKGFEFKFGNFTESVARDLQQLFYLLGIVTRVDAVSGSLYDLKIADSASRHKAFESLFSDLGLVRYFFEGCVNYRCSKLKIPNDEYTRFIADKMYQLIKDGNNLNNLPLSIYMHMRESDFRFINNKRTKTMSVDSYYKLVGVAQVLGIDVNKNRTIKGYSQLLEDYMFVRVSSKKELYNEYDVYDLTVEGTHTFTANGLINHNTTASRIVGRELNNIKDDNYDLLNSPFYYEFDSTVVGNVEEIKKLRDIFTVSFGDYWRIVVLDECVHYDTRIHVMDENGNTFLEKVGKLVSKKPKGWKALSVDDRGNFSYKPILNFFNNGKKDFYEVCIDGITDSVVCTDNHRFFDINFNEVYLRDLAVGDTISTFCGGILEKGIIKSITPYKDSHVSAYDIEVADNHNYITSGGVILHNCHTVSATAQAAMLKMFEETKGKTIYILATTDPQKLLPTIRSRALEINFNDVPVEAIVDNLTKVSEDRGLNLSEEIKLLIADRSGGHMRNAHMLLDKYILLGEEDFKDSIKSSVTLFCDYLIATYKNDKDAVLSNINDLLSIPKDNLQSDWSIVMTESLRSFCGFDCRHKDIKRLVDTYGSDFNIIAQCYMSTWVKNMFIDIPYTQATLLNMYKVVQGALEKKRSQSGVGSVQSVASKYGRPVR
jgi:DNA polymerase III, subunits gamma and tau